mmetsp:Transcript_21107/g.58711  ORF Transcript_21107/g.58711 Transcript_21107/m.58711 type:complete len:246 (+) Transcript_21107:133-870(+)
MVHGDSSHLEALLDGCLPHHSCMRRGYNQPIQSVLQLGSRHRPRSILEADNILPLLWSLLHRFLVPHVLLGQIQPAAGRGGFSGKNIELRVDADVWHFVHQRGRRLHPCALPGQRTDLHDGLRLGQTEPRYQNVHARFLPVQRALPPMGHAHLLHHAGKSNHDGHHRHLRRPRLLLLRVRFPSHRRRPGLEDATRHGTADRPQMDVRRHGLPSGPAGGPIASGLKRWSHARGWGHNTVPALWSSS